MNKMNVLIGYDGSACAEAALFDLERAGLLNGFVRVRDGQELLDCLN